MRPKWDFCLTALLLALQRLFRAVATRRQPRESPLLSWHIGSDPSWLRYRRTQPKLGSMPTHCSILDIYMPVAIGLTGSNEGSWSSQISHDAEVQRRPSAGRRPLMRRGTPRLDGDDG